MTYPPEDGAPEPAYVPFHDRNQYASAQDLLSVQLDDEAVPFVLPSGARVLIRGLSRFELLANGKGTDDAGVMEIRNVASCLVAPKLTVDQAREWSRRSLAGGDFRALSEKIRELSGLGQGADKRDVPESGE